MEYPDDQPDELDQYPLQPELEKVRQRVPSHEYGHASAGEWVKLQKTKDRPRYART